MHVWSVMCFWWCLAGQLFFFQCRHSVAVYKAWSSRWRVRNAGNRRYRDRTEWMRTASFKKHCSAIIHDTHIWAAYTHQSRKTPRCTFEPSHAPMNVLNYYFFYSKRTLTGVTLRYSGIAIPQKIIVLLSLHCQKTLMKRSKHAMGRCIRFVHFISTI